MKKRTAITVISLLSCAAIFANGQAEKGAASQGTKKDAPVAVAPTLKTADGKTELVFWTRINDKFENEIAAFEATHPDVSIKRVGIGSDYDDLQTKYIASSASGELPHVGLVSQRYGIPQLYDAGVIVPMERLMSDAEKADVYDAFWGRYTYKGEKVALPFQVSMPVLYVNLDMLQAKGLAIPTTWEEMMDTAQKLATDTNGDGKIDVYGLGIPSDAPWYLNGFYKSNGAQVVKGDKEVNIDQPAVVKILKDIQSMASNGALAPNQHATAKDDFKNQTVVMLLNSCAGNGSIAKGVKDRFKYAMVHLPTINGKINAPLGGNGMAVFKSNPEMEALSYEFVKFMISPESFSGFSLEKGYVPVTKSAMKAEKVQQRVNDPFWAETFKQLDYLYGQPINPVDATIWKDVNDILSKIEADPKADVAKLVKGMQSDVDDFLLDY